VGLNQIILLLTAFLLFVAAANNLFRQNSIASKIMGAFSRLVAQDYLQQLLKPVVDKTIKLGRKLEVDPEKLTELEQRTLIDNINAVKEVVNELLANIHALTDVLPLYVFSNSPCTATIYLRIDCF